MTANIIGQGNPTPTSAQADTAFQCLVGLIDTSNADPLRRLTAARVPFTLRPPQQAYTIGPDPSLDIFASRPQKIQRANVVDMTQPANPNYIPMRVLEYSEYLRERIRASDTPLPSALWYDRGYEPIANPTNPNPPPVTNPDPGYGTINIVGQPSAANGIELWASAPLTQASTLLDDLVFPPGYYEYLLYGTVIRLYPKFGRDPDATVVGLWGEARRLIESANAVAMPVMTLDSGLPSSGNVYFDGRTNRYIGRN